MTPAAPTAAELAADFLAGDRWRDPLQQMIACDRLDESGRPLDAALRRVLVEPGEDRHRLDYATVLEREAGRVACPTCGGHKGLYQNFGAGHRWQPCATCNGSGLAPDDRAAHAEFIRVQCELANMTCPHNVESELVRIVDCDFDGCLCRWCVLRRRERELLEGHTASWLPDAIHALDLFVDEDVIEGRLIRFRRGFVADLTLPCADLLAHAGAVFACQPVTAVRLANWEPVLVGSYRTRTEPWSFPVSDRPDRRNAIPWAIFEAGGSREWHPTREAAVEWVSAACVAFGRAAAKLPPLPVGAAGR